MRVVQGGVLSGIADARVDINATRLLCLQAAHSMDTVGNKVAKDEIAMIKVRRCRGGWFRLGAGVWSSLHLNVHSVAQAGPCGNACMCCLRVLTLSATVSLYIYIYIHIYIHLIHLHFFYLSLLGVPNTRARVRSVRACETEGGRAAHG